MGQVLRAQPSLPLIIFDAYCCDLSVYETIAEAAVGVEIYDIWERQVFGYDSKGRPLHLFVTKDEKVGIEAASGPARPEAFERTLRQYLEGYGERLSIAPGDIAALVAHAAERHTEKPIGRPLRQEVGTVIARIWTCLRGAAKPRGRTSVEQPSNHFALPLFIFDIDGVNLNVFSNLEDAQAHYEAYDVLEGEYFGFDAKGRPLRFLALDHIRVGIEAADQPAQPEALERNLRAYLKAADARAEDPECDLSCLMAMAVEGYSYVYDPHFTFHFFRDGFRELFAFIRKQLSKNRR